MPKLIFMVDSEYGKFFIILGVIVGVLGVLMIMSGIDSASFFLIEAGAYAISGAGGLVFMGILIHYIGDKPVHCNTCGYKLRSDTYICPNCNNRTPKYYHQKVYCQRCFKRTRYDKYGGRCKYCGSELNLR